MPPSDHALDLPERISFSALTAQAIRRGIDRGAWAGALPSERRLSEVLQVSRPTIRRALAILVREGTLDGPRARQLRTIRAGGGARPSLNRRVIFLSHEQPEQCPPIGSLAFSEIRTVLERLRFTTEFLVCQERSLAAQQRKLAAYFARNRVLSYVLLSLNQELQMWLAGRGVPAMVLGSCHPAVRLPSFDLDNHAVGRSAAGLLLSRGHRRIAFLVPDSNGIGDLATEAGFTEAVRLHAAGDEVQARIVRHDGTPAGLRVRLDALLAGPAPPTGLLVAKPRAALVALVHLLGRGVAVPGRVSIICRDQDDVFGDLRPQLAHFSYDGRGIVRRLGRALAQLAATGVAVARPYRVFPRFVSGTSLARPG
ncbi:MAG: substrate-binding domain-containing protein [Opitutaceae bacterium]|nr:substrate-binding domain-containing protein [Opitutaceae bacterium]